MAFILDIPGLEDASALADWIEFTVMAAGVSQVSRTELSMRLCAPLGCTPQEVEDSVSLACQEIDRRRRVVEDGYPFSTDGPFLKCDLKLKNGLYAFLLLASVNGPMRRARKFKEIDLIFDTAVSEAISRYLGDGSKVLRIGWPTSNGRPKKLEDALIWISDQVGVPVGNGRPSAGLKDGGVDLIAWRSFRDRKRAFTVLFAQCTVQEDWFPKAKDISEYVWLSRLDTGRPALLSLAFPFVVPRRYPKWDELRRQVNIVFDRLRLMEMLRGTSHTSIDGLEEWVVKEWKKAS